MRAVLFALALLATSACAGELPDPVATPGAVNPAVTQENIGSTICVPGWTKTIRPPASHTNRLKASQMAAGPYASTEAPRVFEEDHLISLELGGHPTDARNLWPQRWDGALGAHRKDTLENYLHRAVCAGRIPLAEAQQALATDWVAAYRKCLANTPALEATAQLSKGTPPP